MGNIKIENYLSDTGYTTRKELVKKTGLCDREVRSKISELKKHRAVLYSSNRSGYRLAKEIEEIETQEEAKEEKNLIKHCINDIEGRKSDMSMSEKVYIDYLKRLEHKIMILENMNHIP